jgi:general secretion pathway protein L
MKILGIDIGSTSIKAVEIDSAFGRYEVHEYYEQKIAGAAADQDPAQGTINALAHLIRTLPKKPDRIVFALRTRQITFRNLQLPTRDKKAIQAGVGFELDDELPFSIENAAYDYSVLAQNKAGTQLHVAATLHKNVSAALDIWRLAGIDPDVMTSEAWAYRCILNRVISTEEQERPILLMQMGHQRTILYIHFRGVPVLCREIAWGGKDLTQAICQRYQTPVSQAEEAKLDHGFVVPPSQQADVTPEQAEFSNALLAPVERLLAEIKQAELTCKNITNLTVKEVYISGGTSLLPGLSKLLEEHMKVPVKPLLALSAIATSGVTYSETVDATYLLASALAISTVGSDRATLINFRKGSFAKQGTSREFNMATLRRPLMALTAIGASFFASMLVQSHFYSKKIEDTNTQIERNVKTFFALTSNSALHTYMANLTTLKSSVNKQLSKERELSKLSSPNPRSPVEFLKDISASIPKDVVVDMIHYEVGASAAAPYTPTADSSATLTFLADPKTVEKLSSILSQKLVAMKKTNPEDAKSPDQSSKRVKITFSGKPTDDSFGK